jgi:hypothetical protein
MTDYLALAERLKWLMDPNATDERRAWHTSELVVLAEMALREAHAEIEDWKRVHADLAHASNETLEGAREVFAERDGLRAEVERLRQRIGECEGALETYRHPIEAEQECERLRALLQAAQPYVKHFGAEVSDAIFARIDAELGDKP